MIQQQFHNCQPVKQFACFVLLLLASATSPYSAIAEDDRDWWAFQPLVKPALPVVENERWSQNPLDRFVYQCMAAVGIEPAPPADRATLVRRLYFNLHGLPPTPEQIDAFVSDDSPDAWALLIDNLLDDPRYGEHWARFWLDLVRYAESDGWNKDAYRPNIWRYRDYVVQSFNDDLPFPDFVLQQLAGDEIPSDNPQHRVATGFLRLGIYEYNQRDARGHWNDIMNETTDVVGDVFLGMGMACARCHDHKFDPILQSDYFKLRAFFEPITWQDDIPSATTAEQATYQTQHATWKEATQKIRARLDTLLDPYRDSRWKSTIEKFPLEIQACFYKASEERNSWEDQMAYLITRQFYEEGTPLLKGLSKEHQQTHKDLLKELAAFDSQKPDPLPEMMTIVDARGPISHTVIPDDDSESIEPGYLSVLSSPEQDAQIANFPTPDSSGRRTALAQWIGRADNPLTHRVFVNRIWQQHFGEGIVPSSSDFGHRGQPPTHPQLLDWLVTTFVEDGWSMKRLHKTILTSAAWQQAADHPQAADNQTKDPADQLLWHAPIRRLTAEQNRDAMLAVSGELQTELGGPSVTAEIPRRSLYLKILRNTPEPMLQAFDAAGGLTSVAQRNTTTTPTQSLLMINGSYTLERADIIAKRLLRREPETTAATLNYAFRLAWGRPPTTDELASALTFLDQEADQPHNTINPDQLADFCHVLLNSNEFLYVD